MEGRIKLHRKMIEWEWYDDINTMRLFLHLLLIANHKETKWRWSIVKEWEILTGRYKLSEQTWLTPQQIRTSLDKLKSTNEITTKTTNKYSIITLLNWDKYQNWEEEVTNKTTNKPPNKQQTNNQQVTTSKNDNNDNNEKNNIISKDIKPTVYWNEEINSLLEIIKKHNNWICDWAQKEQRQYWNLLLNKIKKIDKIENWNYTRSQYVSWLLEVVSQNKFFSHKISWPKKIYYALAELIQVANQTMEKKKEIPTFTSL